MRDHTPNTTYYVVNRDDSVHKVLTRGLATSRYHKPSWMYDANQVWCEGPQGGISLVHQSWKCKTNFKTGYVKNDPEAMKEFMWIKLRAADPA
jgi:hypothetical protein